jgi:hypothetical protein
MSRVNEFEKMRPDLMSNRVYGTQDGWDLLLKYNGISNPFSLNEGDLLYAVNYSDLTTMVNVPLEISERSGKTESDFKPISPNSNKDSNRVSNLRNKYKNRNSQSPQRNSSLPPNLSTRPSIQQEGGQIVLGQNNTTADNNNIGDSLSRSRLKSALLKNRLSL